MRPPHQKKKNTTRRASRRFQELFLCGASKLKLGSLDNLPRVANIASRLLRKFLSLFKEVSYIF
jgi:hypothetical protein